MCHTNAKDQLATVSELAARICRLRSHARMMRNGTNVYGYTEARQAERQARTLEDIVRNMADGNMADAAAATETPAAHGVPGRPGAERREHQWNEARKLIDAAISAAYRDPAGKTGDDCAVETSNARLAALDFVKSAIRDGVQEVDRG
jgi:hypothetical protein